MNLLFAAFVIFAAAYYPHKAKAHKAPASAPAHGAPARGPAPSVALNGRPS